MSRRRWLALVCAVAALHGLFFLWYQSPDWTTSWTDQDGYRRLGQVLATTGKFTRFPDAPAFVPEVIRTPAYPLFVAVIYRIFGVSQVPVAVAQIALFMAICVLVYAIARRVASEETARVAALLTALFPPLPYFAALVMTEVWTTALFTLSMWIAVRAIADGHSPRTRFLFVALGVTLAVTSLSRPAFALFPAALALVGVVILPRVEPAAGRRVGAWAAMFAVFAVMMLPWLAYNYVTVGRATLSPAGGVGRGIWEGSWQASWSGRLQNELTTLANDIDDRQLLARRVEGVAEREHLPAEPMLEYVHQWKDIRRIWTEPIDSAERARARVRADGEYLRIGLDNVRRDTASHLAKRLGRGVFILWAGEIPFRYSDINRLPPAVIYLCWVLQAALVCLALAGLIALRRAGRTTAACMLATPIVYVTAVHFPLLTEARQSLPAQPVVLLLSAIGMMQFGAHLLPRKPQVHKAEHL